MKNDVLDHLMDDYNLQPAAAARICNDAIELYHRLLTIVDYNVFDSMNHQVLSSLLIIIRENFELNENFK